MSLNRQNCQFRKILVGYDGSQISERALESALALAVRADSEVEILSVVRPPEPVNTLKRAGFVDRAREQYERTLRRISDAVTSNSIRIRTLVLIGHPAEQILERAGEIDADLIVVGERGASKLGEGLGSVSEIVLAQASCPVLVTR